MKIKEILSLILLLTVLAGLFTGCAAEESKKFQSLADFETATIGILTGSSFDSLSKERFPWILAQKATAEIAYYHDPQQKLCNIINAKI